MKLILFDIGGVLLLDRGYKALMQEILNPKGDPNFGQEYAQAVRRSHLGKTTLLEDQLEFVRMKELAVDKARLQRFNTHDYLQLHTLNAPLLSLIQSLSSFRHSIISDTTEVHAAANSSLKLFQLFEDVYSSYQFGEMKNSEEFFAEALLRAGLKGSEVLFIDDKVSCGENAEQLGIRFLHYENFEKLERDLRALNILPSK